MQRNPIVNFAFYICITISIASVLFWFGLGVSEWVNNISEVFIPYIKESDSGTPIWLIDLAHFFGILALGLLIAFLFLYFALGRILSTFVKPSGEYFNKQTSIATTISRDKDDLVLASTRLTFILSFLISFWLLQNDYSPTYLWSVTILLALYAAFQTFLIYCGIAESYITHTYYFKTKPGYDFYNERFGNGWTDQVQELFNQIDPISTDYQVALKLRASALGEDIPKSPHYDYIGGGDPSIQYGPYTDKERIAMNEQHQAYEFSDKRVG
ncbi:hypothetical protein [Marinicellulosiphila megalodicopiae]|uniref:hypothetical protein n=1 Tax=Marinicellulosiphila megalodicopiae TaxID=2724896 RepID=UPI003BAE4A24